MGCVILKPKNYLLNNLIYTQMKLSYAETKASSSMCVCNNYANFANFIWNVGAQSTCVT